MREFVVGAWLVRPDRNAIVRDGTELHIEPRIMDLLVYFAERPNEVLSGDQLIRDVWHDAETGDSALLTAISALRKAFGDDARRPAVIETIPKRGYRLIADSSARTAALAVLPFQNLSGKQSEEFFADGMTDLLIAELGRIPALRVISRQSVMRYRDSERALPAIASALNAGLIVEGSTLLSRGRARITVQLIDAIEDSHLWAQSYERDFGDVLSVQRQIAEAVAGAISGHLRPLRHPEPTKQTVQPDALVAYLRGRFHWYKLSPAHFDRALAYFEQAREADPGFAPAYGGIADVWGAYGYWGLRPPSEIRHKIYEALKQGEEVDPSDADVQALLGSYYLYCDRDYPTAEASFRRSVELNPNAAHARMLYSLFLATMKRPQAIDEIDMALRLDPLNPTMRLVRAMWLSARQDYGSANHEIDLLLDIEPRHPPGLQLLADLHWLQDDDRALECERHAWSGDKELCAALTGDDARRPQETLNTAAEALTARARKTYVQPRQIARLLAHAGRIEKALDCLEQAVARDDLMQIDFLQLSPAWNPMRTHPRFVALLSDLGLPA